jgi:aryl-alcohol dehydrogenase-like predicted oxidoreductase
MRGNAHNYMMNLWTELRNRRKIWKSTLGEVLLNTEQYVHLGKTDITISPIGLGIMQWGDIKLSDQPVTEANKDIVDIFNISLDKGINFFDTAEIYGNGRSEIYLGRCLKDVEEKVIIATKFMPFPWRFFKGELKNALTKSLKRLGVSRVDLYQIHWPIPTVSIKTWMDAMADAVADGLIRAVGVSNYSPSQTEIAFNTLSKHGIPLASNQVKFSLLDRHPEYNGLVKLCKKLGITVIAYSPLEKGILSGKYTANNIPSGLRSWRYNKSYLSKIEPLIQTLLDIGKNHGGKTTGQISLNWLAAKGAVPIPGARNLAQAKENAEAMGWQLTTEEVARLDQISSEV